MKPSNSQFSDKTQVGQELPPILYGVLTCLSPISCFEVVRCAHVSQSLPLWLTEAAHGDEHT